jgi:hypothetical protein
VLAGASALQILMNTPAAAITFPVAATIADSKVSVSLGPLWLVLGFRCDSQHGSYMLLLG